MRLFFPDITNVTKNNYFIGLWSASFSSLPGLKCVFRRAGTYIISPVRGLRALRALRSLTLKVPNPLISILWPFSRDFFTVSRKESTTTATSVLVRPVFSATFSTKSALVTVSSLDKFYFDYSYLFPVDSLNPIPNRARSILTLWGRSRYPIFSQKKSKIMGLSTLF